VVARCAEDSPLPLDEVGLANMSAPHAYLLSFRLAELSPGDSLVELGTGSGYGAALASRIVGPAGRVVTFEIDPDLVKRADKLLSDLSNVSVVVGDAVASDHFWQSTDKIICTFAVREIPAGWALAVPAKGCLVVPVGKYEADQRLVRIARVGAALVTTDHGAVRYVPNRSPVRNAAT
jgi:protein-L-isoaspartate(D-aspartate) O-methyltransferase